jgi:hypothetical protein
MYILKAASKVAPEGLKNLGVIEKKEIEDYDFRLDRGDYIKVRRFFNRDSPLAKNK